MKFWDKVNKCRHEATANYAVHVRCLHKELGCAGGIEWQCKHCGIYITDDPCGDMTGMSGWPASRWKGKRMWSGTWGKINGA